MHKSIFDRVKDYKSNPKTEFFKIDTFIESKKCYYNWTVSVVLSEAFKYSQVLASVYIDLNDCISRNVVALESHRDLSYSNLPTATRERMLDEFLTYCEIIGHLYRLAKKYVTKNFPTSEFNSELFEQTLSLLQTSLKSINYKIEFLQDSEEVIVAKINPVAEIVAEQAPPTIRRAIVEYLGVRDSNLEDKESKLHALLDLLEPMLQKYQQQDKVSKIKQYIQLIRHPETKKTEPQYEWYFSNKSKYLDDIFTLCLYVQLYDETKNILDSFNKKTNT